MTRFFSILVGLFLFAVSQAVCASAWKTNSIYNGATSAEASLADLIRQVSPGSVVIVSENHGFQPHHENQVRVLEALHQEGFAHISVGMEFLTRNHQDVVDRFTGGKMAETDFLKEVEWGGNDFGNYRRQVLFPATHGGETRAINAPRELSGRVAKVGIAGLSVQERAQLPPDFTLGNPGYFERFRETMQGHVSDAAIQKYFEAQSVWDETMAFEVSEFMRLHPDHVMVIIVGDFHASYGGGLPDRLRARGVGHVLTVSQLNLEGASDDEENLLVRPHSQWGARGEYVWVER